MQPSQNRYTDQYQQVPQSSAQQQYGNANLSPNISVPANKQNISPSYKTDKQFYNSLTNYTPMCYRGNGVPLFMTNKGWYLSLGCIAVINGIFIMALLIFIKSSTQGLKPMGPQTVRKYKIINIVILAAINITYFLTQFLNPGIKNLSSISDQQYDRNGKYFCTSCNGYRTEDIQHCRDCDVCIKGLDHHCGFFSKCIGGFQRYMFYAFICTVLLGFLCLIVTLTATI